MDDGREVVVGEHHFRGVAGGGGALVAHRDADVGALQRGSVVDAVAGHRGDVALALQRFDQPQLVLGAGAGVEVYVAHGGWPLRGVERVEVGTGEHAGGVEAELLADSLRGDGVVAGDHLDHDARGVTRGDGLPRLVARRVGEPEHGEQGEAAALDAGEIELGGDLVAHRQRE